MDWEWIVRNLDEIGLRTLEHVLLTIIAIVIGFAISFGLALVIRRLTWLEAPIIGVSGVLYAIPSLALFAFLVPFTGIQNPLTAEIALVSYTILILLRNILAGLDAVPREVIEAAD
ncbi:MAG: ABC transporter permease, partial [Candidatus Limnocylindria bacterium]